MLIPVSSILPPLKKQTNSDEIKQFIFLYRDEDTKETYENFKNDMLPNLSKIKNTASITVSMLLNKNILYLGMPIGTTSPLLGMFLTENDILSLIVLNINALDIDIKTGHMSDPDSVIYASYLQFIRATCSIYSKEIERNSNIHKLLIEYYCFLLMKVLKLPLLNEKQTELFKFLTGVMYFKHFYKYNDTYAIELCEPIISKEYFKEFQSSIKNSNIVKYDNIKDLIKLIGEFKLSFDPPNQLLFQLITSIKTLGFQGITSEIYDLIAATIVSQYPNQYFQALMINRQSQGQIENIISSYFSKIAFKKL